MWDSGQELQRSLQLVTIEGAERVFTRSLYWRIRDLSIVELYVTEIGTVQVTSVFAPLSYAVKYNNSNQIPDATVSLPDCLGTQGIVLLM